MPNPVPIPAGPLDITDDDSTLAEAFVAAIAQVMLAGTSGGTPGRATPATIFAAGADALPSSLVLATKEQQLFFRQMGIAIAKSMALGSTVIPGGDSTPTTFSATCPSGASVGDLVYVSSAGYVTPVDITDVAKVPAVGCILSKSSSTSCLVQTAGLAGGLYSGLTAGAMYYSGLSSRPSILPTPSVGQSLFLQALGIALDPTTLILAPSIVLTRIRG